MSTTVASIDSTGNNTATKHLEQKAVKGAKYVIVAYGLSTCIRLTSSMVLSRLFMPSYFGLMALTSTIIVGLYLISHFGLEDGVVQHAKGEDVRFLFTAWTVQVIRGFALFLITIPLAFPVAAFYHEHLLVVLLPLLGITCILGSLTSPSLLVMARQMGVARITSLELLTSFTQFVATAIWALIHPSIWALVGGRIIADLVTLIASYYVAPSARPRLMLDREACTYFVRFGRWILLSTVLAFFALQSDRLILGKLVSWQMLGVYGIAYTLSDMPRQVIMQLSRRVGTPFIARYSKLPRPEFRTSLLGYRRYILALGALALTLVISTGDILIKHVYDHRYHQAAWMVVILACGLWHTLLAATITPVLMSIQKVYYHTLAMTLYCVALFICLPIGFHLFGMPGAVTAIAVSDLPVYIVGGIALVREKLCLFWQDVQMTLLFLGLLGLALLIRHYLHLPSPFYGIQWPH